MNTPTDARGNLLALLRERHATPPERGRAFERSMFHETTGAAMGTTAKSLDSTSAFAQMASTDMIAMAA